MTRHIGSDSAFASGSVERACADDVDAAHKKGKSASQAACVDAGVNSDNITNYNLFINFQKFDFWVDLET